MRIVVLCGGLSNERDVSITSGTGVAKALRSRGHQVVLMDIYFGYTGTYRTPDELFLTEQNFDQYSVGETAPNLDEIRAMRKQNNDSIVGDNVFEICRAADIVFMALHGEEGENGKIQAALDVAGIPYTGSGYLGAALAMNKSLTKELFHNAGIATPPGVQLKRGEDFTGASVGFPCVVKPCSGGSSVGTSIVQSQEEYAGALELAFQYEETVLVEKFIKARELTVGVMDGVAMPVIEIIPKSGFYDYKNKYQAGFTEEICPAEIGDAATQRVQRLAEQVGRVLRLDAYYRADFLWDTEADVFYCLEANTLPGMTPTSLIPQMAAQQGLDYGDLCEKIIEVSLKKYGK
jgi:D-alanine-D-alanine ligase